MDHREGYQLHQASSKREPFAKFWCDWHPDCQKQNSVYIDAVVCLYLCNIFSASTGERDCQPQKTCDVQSGTLKGDLKGERIIAPE